MKRNGTRRTLAAVCLAAALAGGCGDDDDDSGLRPGAATFAGNVSNAATAAALRPDSLWARVASLFGWPRTAEAQNGGDLGGIVVAIRGDGEADGITDDEGRFQVSGAPTGNVTVFFRRGQCEAGFPLQQVPSRSTISLSDVSFGCDSASPGAIGERFEAVLRDRPGAENDLDTCARAGRDDVLRHVSAEGAEIEFSDGRAAGFSDLDADDRLEIEGRRAGTGAPGTLAATRIRILERDVNDPCDDDPFE